MKKPIYLFFVVNNNSYTPVNNAKRSNTNKLLHNSKNFSYINHNLMNLNKFSTDIHDYAYFANINSLKQLNIFSTYPLYHIKDFSLSVTSSSTLTPPSSQEKRLNSECVNNNNFVNLNKWFESILDFLHLIKHSPTHAQQHTTTIEPELLKVHASSSSSCACVTQLKSCKECILEGDERC